MNNCLIIYSITITTLLLVIVSHLQEISQDLFFIQPMFLSTNQTIDCIVKRSCISLGHLRRYNFVTLHYTYTAFVQ